MPKTDKDKAIRVLVKKGFKVPLDEITEADALLLHKKGMAVEGDGDTRLATVRREKRRRVRKK